MAVVMANRDNVSPEELRGKIISAVVGWDKVF